MPSNFILSDLNSSGMPSLFSRSLRLHRTRFCAVKDSWKRSFEIADRCRWMGSSWNNFIKRSHIVESKRRWILMDLYTKESWVQYSSRYHHFCNNPSVALLTSWSQQEAGAYCDFIVTCNCFSKCLVRWSNLCFSCWPLDGIAGQRACFNFCIRLTDALFLLKHGKDNWILII